MVGERKAHEPTRKLLAGLARPGSRPKFRKQEVYLVNTKAKTRLRIWGIALILPVTITAAATIRHRSKAATIAPTDASQLHKQSGLRARLTLDTQQNVDQVELITLRPYGCEPSAITFHPRPFILAIDNRSGAIDLMVHIISDSGGSVLDQPLTAMVHDSSNVLNLPPGTYHLTEDHFAGWTCTITVSAN